MEHPRSMCAPKGPRAPRCRMRGSVGSVQVSSFESGHCSPTPLSAPPVPSHASPYSCVILPRPLSSPVPSLDAAPPTLGRAQSVPPGRVSAAHHGRASSSSAPIGTPPSPPFGCRCLPSSGSASSLGGATCQVHERIFTCPPPPQPVTCGVSDRELLLGGPCPNSDGDVCIGQHEASPQDYREDSVKELLLSLHHQVAIMSLNLSAKIDEIQCHQHADTSAALHAIRTQLQDLTKSVESYQSEVVEVKRDMVAIKHEIDTLQAAKEEIEELREAVDRLEEHHRRRKVRLLEQGLTCFLCYAIFAAVLGMFQFGYNTGVINAPQSIFIGFIQQCWKDRYNKDMEKSVVDFMWSVAVSIFAIGGMLGGVSGGSVGNRFGRKKGLLLNNFIGILGGCLMGFSHFSRSFEMLIFGRLVIGINCGLNTSLVPMYISEIAPLNLRGGLGTVNQLAVTVGLLLSQVLGIDHLLGNEKHWPILLGLAVVPAAMQLVLLPVCPESPRHLLMTKQLEDEARKALRRLRSSPHVEEDIDEMRAEEAANQAEAHISMRQLIRSSTLRMPLVIGIVMQLSQQLSGINAVLYYSTTLFTEAGLQLWQSMYATIGVGVVMVIMTLVSIPLMDKAGRRTLHLYGLGGMFVFSVFITISFLIKQMMEWMKIISVMSTLCFVIFFSIGPGSIPWMITAELFSQGPRPAAMSIAVLINWLSNFLVGIGFLKMKEYLDNYTFLPFSILLGIFWVFTYYKVPETKNKTFEEISAIFQRGAGRDYLDDPRLYGDARLPMGNVKSNSNSNE